MPQHGPEDMEVSNDRGGRHAGAPPLAGRVLLTGATGFVGQALLERLLTDHPDTVIDLVLRAGREVSAQERFAELMGRSAFAGLRDRLGAAGVAAELRRRVTLLEGDLQSLDALTRSRPAYDLIFHCAGDVDFRAPLDRAFATNVDGVRCVLDVARRQPVAPHVVHVSTAYVWADRTRLGEEVTLPHDLDWRDELRRAAARTAAMAQLLTVEGLHDTSEARDRTTRATGDRSDDSPGRHGASTPGPLDVSDHEITPPPNDRRFLEHLAEWGHLRARELGWTDVYTLSKALGERVAEDLGAAGPLTIVRPTIIESALHRPYPGWVDGFKVADPLFAAYAKGRLPGFPGRADSVVDIIPVDVVVNAMLAAARRPPHPGSPRYLTVGTSVSNPLRLDDLRELAMGYFDAHPWRESDGTPVRPPRWHFVDPGTMAQRLARTSRRLRAVRAMADRAPGRSGRRLRSRLARASRRLASTRKFVQLYEPYTCSLTRYDDARLRELDRSRPDTERQNEPLDVAAWFWRDYWCEVHLPALSQLMLTAADRSAAVPVPDLAPLDLSTVPVVSPRGRAEEPLAR